VTGAAEYALQLWGGGLILIRPAETAGGEAASGLARRPAQGGRGAVEAARRRARLTENGCMIRGPGVPPAAGSYAVQVMPEIVRTEAEAAPSRAGAGIQPCRGFSPVLPAATKRGKNTCTTMACAGATHGMAGHHGNEAHAYRSATFSASSRLFDFSGELKRARSKLNSPIIAPA
jgi:hypothetical protein